MFRVLILEASRIGGLRAYLNLPKPTLLQAPIINPIMEKIRTQQKSRFSWVKVGFK